MAQKSIFFREAGIVSFSVTEVPCGHCRQFMKEYRRSDEIMIDLMSKGVEMDLLSLLPANFGPKDLDV